jgi:ribosome-binding protein aMBF1 (putative translation factor)
MTKLYGSRTRMLHAGLPNADVVAVNANHVDKYFGDLMRGQRTSCGLSQERLARKLRIDPEDIDAYETGMKHMSTDLVLQIARGFSGRRSLKLTQPCATEHYQGQFEGAAENDTILDEEMQLRRAFVRIKSAALRKSIVDFVVDLAASKNTV